MNFEFNAAVFDQFPVLKTPRLTLRDIREEDADQIFLMRSNKRVNQFIARPQMREQDAAQQLAIRTADAFKNKQAIGWAGLLRDGKTIIGTCGFNSIEPHNLHAEIGGEMATEYWGKGIAQEAVQAILAFGIDVMNLKTIEAKVAPDNRGAIFILESLGFVKEAHYANRIVFEQTFRDMAVYTLHSNQFIR